MNPHGQELTYDDARGIHELKARYFRFVDTKQWSNLRALYTTDAVFEGHWSAPRTPEEFISTVSMNLPVEVVSVHQGFMPELVPLQSDRVRGVWAMTDFLTWPVGSRSYMNVAVPGQWGFRGYGHYEDEYIRVGGRWLITSQRLTRIRVDPLVGDIPPQPEYPVARADPDWLT